MPDKLLTRYCFKTGPNAGFGVTAYSIDDAKTLLAQAGCSSDALKETNDVLENVDVSKLDANHILPNIGPSNLRGVWYPCLNLA